jgi:hypothetical protein
MEDLNNEEPTDVTECNFKILFLGDNFFLKNQCLSIILTERVQKHVRKVICCETRSKEFILKDSSKVKLTFLNIDSTELSNETTAKYINTSHAVIYFNKSDYLNTPNLINFKKINRPKYIVIHNDNIKLSKVEKDVYEIFLNDKHTIEKFINNLIIDMVTLYKKDINEYDKINENDVNKIYFKYVKQKQKGGMFCCTGSKNSS